VTSLKLVIETLRFGQVHSFIGHLNAHARQNPLGRWVSEFGKLNQVYTLLDAGGAETAPFPTEHSAYADQHAGNVLQREVRFLSAAKEYRPSSEKLFELREYAINPGQTKTFMQLMLSALPVRERYSANVGVWTPLSGDPDRVIHLWAYRDLSHRDEVRARVAQEPSWKQYGEAIVPLLREMMATVLIPA
jgi:hypothetical protein